MCKIINFSMYKGTKKENVEEKVQKAGRSIKTYKFVSKEWFEEFQKNGWGVSKLIVHVIEQYGYIRCGDGKKYTFEEVKRDVKYHEMYPEIEENFKAPLWVKINGEWYFVEYYTDFTSNCNLKCKWAQIGNHDVKGFFVNLYGLNRQKLKRMIEENDLAGAVKEIVICHIMGYHSVMGGNTDCKASVSFGSETVKRDCIYKLVELEAYRYAILEGTELKDGSKHMVLLYDTVESKEYAGYFREKYKNAGVPLLYGQWSASTDNWKSCIKNKEKLYKRLVRAE